MARVPSSLLKKLLENMEAITLLISAVASAFVFLLQPVYGLIVYVAVLAYYPTYLTVPLGTVDFTACRILIIAIFTKLFLQTNSLSRFKFVWLDKLVIIYFTAQLLAGSITAPSLMKFFENRAGAAFDMVLPYFAVRMIIRNKQQYLSLLKGVLTIAAPLAIIGLYQCVTGHNPVGFFMKYHGWMQDFVYVPIGRKGLYRANVTFSVSIMFGLFFAMFGPVCVGILGSVRKYRALYWIGLGLMGVGIFSSMSAGPWLAVLLAILFIILYFYRRYWKIAVTMAVVMCGTVEIISNRHFYEVIDHFTFSGSTAWYRSRLIEVGLFEGGMSGHWITGYGYDVDPGWGPKVDGRPLVDIVNEYLVVLKCYGVMGLLPFLLMIALAIKRLIHAYNLSARDSDKWLIWCLGAALFGLSGAMMSVSLFGPPTTIFYIMLGFCGAMPNIVKKADRVFVLLPASTIHLREKPVSRAP